MKESLKSRLDFPVKTRFWGGLTLIILIAISTNFVFSNRTNALLDDKIAEAKEAKRPAEIDIIILQESSCEDCFSVAAVIAAIKQENVKVNSERTVEILDLEGSKLVSQYNITKVPTFIISGEIEKENSLKTLWPEIGKVQDNTFVFTEVGAPFVLPSSGDVRGRVKISMIMDRNCSECYDVTNNEGALERFGVPTDDQQIVEIGQPEGMALIEKYKIELIPTIIIEGDVETHSSLTAIWSEIGTIEEDGAYVMRDQVKLMGTYKDLTTDEVIEPETSQDE